MEKSLEKNFGLDGLKFLEKGWEDFKKSVAVIFWILIVIAIIKVLSFLARVLGQVFRALTFVSEFAGKGVKKLKRVKKRRLKLRKK
ncbi:hypothetical protein [Iriri virus]|uniref:Uncharacterized protein n=1 Tax=Iriri virus TaxID=1620893 RepID=A0A0D3R1N5_9RHAB|nr:hypothetical protein [Iriri virus]AJR28380.1 hypothetical protein [Iriri virus]